MKRLLLLQWFVVVLVGAVAVGTAFGALAVLPWVVLTVATGAIADDAIGRGRG